MLKLLLVFLLIPLLSIGQKQANFWPLRVDIGIDFNYNRFTPVEGTGTYLGYTASVSDGESGQLLFYTDGRNVWNRKFQRMPNGFDLRGGVSTPQACLIVPVPESDERYFLFTTKAYSDSLPYFEGDSPYTGLYFSVVDMSLEKGMGDVTATKNVLLLEKSTEKLTAVPHTNGNDYWLLSHEHATDRFVVFPVTKEGIGSPSYYSFGTINLHFQEQGWLVPSPDGKLLACAPGLERAYAPLELYDFDAASGEISNLRELGSFPSTVGASFSPDNSKVYLAYADSISLGNTVQYDLVAGDWNAVVNSKTELKFIFPTGLSLYDTLAGARMQIAPDGRIYTEYSLRVITDQNNERVEKRIILFIDKPNLPGWDCAPSYRLLDVETARATTIGIGIPNFMQSYFNNLEPVENSFIEDECRNISLTVYPNPTTSKVYIDVSVSNCSYPMKLDLYNVSGQRLRGPAFVSEPPVVDLSIEASGVYILLIETPFNTFVRKIIKQ